MKRVLLFSFLFIAGITICRSQCVVYADKKTGAFGAGYNIDNAPTTYAECEAVAIKYCKDNGGTGCELIFRSAQKGWWAVISGPDAQGRLVFQGATGKATKAEAEEAVKKLYTQIGGLNADKQKITSWYVYSNLKE